ncbi:hypothetical protein [Streptomyces sp. NPDC088258]|uniref:hypothetical protein n=1 Tax=Streptomyces sp. NPDC088258 TaxID=3365849 RepID=UPI00380A507E
MGIEQLTEQARQLDDSQIQLLCEMAESLRRPCDVWVNHESDLVSNRFSDAMLNRLKLHHATSEEKFKKASFEYAFVSAARYAGFSSYKTRSQTFQGADVVMDSVRWSLKTEASANIHESNITVSKFSEARWIRDCLTPEDFAKECIPRFLKHLGEYDRVITLRAFDAPGDRVRYHLVEIPKGLLALVGRLKPDDFSVKTKSGGSSALVCDSSGVAFRVVLDGSVEKVTLARISVDRCIRHAIWTVPTIPDSSQ